MAAATCRFFSSCCSISNVTICIPKSEPPTCWMASTWATRNSVGCFPTLLMPTTNTGRPFACNWREAGRTSTSEFFWRETSAGCPSRIIACCCGLEVRKAMVSFVETQPPSAAQSATIPRLRMTRAPQTRQRYNRNRKAWARANARGPHRGNTVCAQGKKTWMAGYKPGHDGEWVRRVHKQKRPGLSTRPLQTLIRRCKLKLSSPSSRTRACRPSSRSRA